MAGLEAVFKTVQANMQARQSGLTFYVGARNLGKNTGGNTVTFVPTNDAFLPGVQQAGGNTYTRPTGVAGLPPLRAQRVIRVKRSGFNVYLWGVPTSRADTRVMDSVPIDDTAGMRSSLGQVEAMLDSLVNAMHEAMSGPNLAIDGGHWADQTGESTSQYGLLYQLECSANIPVIYEETRELLATAASAPVPTSMTP